MKAELPAPKYNEMKQSISRLRAHLEWHTLKDSERRCGDPPIFLMDQNLAADIRNEQCRFLRAERELGNVLINTIWISGKERAKYRGELRKLNEEFRKLNLPKGI